MNIPIVIVAAALFLAAAVGVAIVWWRRKKIPRCACFELIGDNPDCPIADHHITAHVHNGSAENRGRV